MLLNDNLGKRSVRSVKWNLVSSAIEVLLIFVKQIILARLLPVATFGIYFGASSVINIVLALSSFGMGGAFLHRSKETDDIQQTAGIHFTLQLIFNIVWTVLMLSGIYLFTDPSEQDYRIALVVITLTTTISQLTVTHRLILVRQVKHQRLAVLRIVRIVSIVITSTVVAIYGFNIYALLIDNILTALMNIIFFIIYNPVWKPRLVWSIQAFKYFVNFGARQVAGTWLFDALQRIDKLWIMNFLGNTPLGYYSKAYSFAKFPNEFLGTSMDEVAVGTYAELKYDREGISHAFTRANSVIIRAGFFIVGIMALVAPEFIRIALGVKWMPMLTTFRLLLPFTMFDPIKNTLSSIFIAVGKPEIIVNVRLSQLVVLAIGLFTLGNLYGIEGAAMAIDLMVIIGTFYMLHLARKYVDISLNKLFAFPAIGLFLGLAGGYLGMMLFPELDTDILTAMIKSILFTGIYGAVLIIFDRQEILAIHKTIRKNF